MFRTILTESVTTQILHSLLCGAEDIQSTSLLFYHQIRYSIEQVTQTQST